MPRNLTARLRQAEEHSAEIYVKGTGVRVHYRPKRVADMNDLKPWKDFKGNSYDGTQCEARVPKSQTPEVE